MAYRFSDEFIAEVVDHNDIEDVVSSYVALNRRSGSNRFGLCPFHSEKTGSFSVSSSKQIYHCFGCGKGGGVINFIMEIEHLNYPDAIVFLANRAGIPVPPPPDDPDFRKRERRLALNKAAARFFYEQLSTPAGAVAAAYMDKRMITRKVAMNFGLGFAPDSWDSLRRAMHREGFTDIEMFDLGLIKQGKKEGSFYDTFRNRLMFPIISASGHVIGFSGRALSDDGGPKYLNSSESSVFSKGSNLFALNLAKKSKADYFILVEGNVDVVSLHQAGFDSAVASLGTALTDEQARLLSRFKNSVVLCYDNDGAGTKATDKAIKIFEHIDMDVKVVRTEGAKDPDEFIKAFGADRFRKLIEGSADQLDYRLKLIRDKYNLSDASEKVSYIKEAARLLSQIPGKIEREVYADRLAEETGVSRAIIIDEVSVQYKNRIRNQRKAETKAAMNPVASSQPASRSIVYTDVTSAKAEEGVIRILCLDPAAAKNVKLPEPSDFSSETLGHIYSIIRDRIDRSAIVDINLLGIDLTTDEMNLLIRITNETEQLSSSESNLREYLKVIEKQRYVSGLTDLRAYAEYLKNNGKGIR